MNVTICATHTIRYNIIYSRYTGVLYVQIDEFLVPCSLLVVTHKEEKKKGRGGEEICCHHGQSLQRSCTRQQPDPTNPRTEAEPQQIVAQRLLSCLQYHVPIKSSTEDLTRPTFRVVVKYRADQSYWYSNTGQGEYRRCQHGF